MTKKMGCLAAVVVLAVLGQVGQCAMNRSVASSAAKTADSVAALPPASRATYDSSEARKQYRAGLTNAKTDEHGLLRRNFYICQTESRLARVEELFRTDPEAAAKFAGDANCDVTQAGREVIVDGIPAMGYKRVHYTGDPTPWFVDADAVASLTSTDADSLRLKRKSK